MIDLPVSERYTSEMKERFQKPKMRSFSEAKVLQKEEEIKKSKMGDGFNLINTENQKDRDMTQGLSESFKNAVFMKRNKVEDLPYILGYTGFRPGVTSQSYFGKSIKNESIKSFNNFLEKQHS